MLDLVVALWIVALVVTTGLFVGVVGLQSLLRTVRRLRGPEVVPGRAGARAA